MSNPSSLLRTAIKVLQTPMCKVNNEVPSLAISQSHQSDCCFYLLWVRKSDYQTRLINWTDKVYSWWSLLLSDVRVYHSCRSLQDLFYLYPHIQVCQNLTPKHPEVSLLFSHFGCFPLSSITTFSMDFYYLPLLVQPNKLSPLATSQLTILVLVSKLVMVSCCFLLFYFNIKLYRCFLAKCHVLWLYSFNS